MDAYFREFTEFFFSSIERIGIEKGRQEGLQTLNLRLLRRKLGDLAEEIAQQVKTLKAEQLEELGEALLDFTDLAQLKSWLQAKAVQS